MSWLAWIILGLIAGAIAKALHPGKDPGGFFVTMLIGIVGAIVGGWIGSSLLHWELGGFWNFRTWFLAIAGAVLLLVIYSALTRRRSV